MNAARNHSPGFTVIELIVSIVFLLAAGLIFMWQFNNLKTSYRDDQRRTAINSIYYSLEEVYHKQNGYYPSEINDDTLASIDKQILIDPNGNKLGTAESDYRYEPTKCQDNKCQSYSLRADLQNEADYVRKNKD